MVEPPLLKALEDRIVELHAVGDERWTVLLASWMMAFGCLRHTHTHHALGAEEVNSSLPALPLPERKQKHARDGFDYAVPACFSGGFFWTKEVIEAHRALAPARQRVSILEVQETMQAEMAVLLDSPEEVTMQEDGTYAGTAARKWARGAALGDWQNKGNQPDVGDLRQYSSVRSTQPPSR